MSNRWRQSTRMSATDVRELVSSAMRRISLDRHAREQRHRRHRPVGPDADAGHEAVVGRAGIRSTASRPRSTSPSCSSARRRTARRSGRASDPARGRAPTSAAAHSGTPPRRCESDTARSHETGTKRPSRSTGVEAGRLDVAPHVLERRAPRPVRRVVARRHVVDIVGAEGQRHLGELGPVAQPVHLDVSARSAAASRAIATIFTSS